MNGWATTDQIADYLCVDRVWLLWHRRSRIKDVVARKCIGGSKMRWSVDDARELMRIKRATGLQLVYAVRVMSALRRNALRYEHNRRDTMTIKPGEDWLTTQQAADRANVAVHTLHGQIFLKDIITTRSRVEGKVARGRGELWYRPDLDEVLRIRKECRLSLPSAARTFQALREGRLNGGVT